MMQQLHIRFDPVQNGWLPVTIDATDQQLAFVASFTPHDSLAQLIDALLMLLSSDGTSSVIWWSEPMEYVFTFTATDEVADLTIRAFPDHRRTSLPEAPVLTVQADRQVVVRSFWRALRRLQTQDDFSEQWRCPFPHNALAHLTAMLSASRLA